MVIESCGIMKNLVTFQCVPPLHKYYYEIIGTVQITHDALSLTFENFLFVELLSVT